MENTQFLQSQRSNREKASKNKAKYQRKKGFVKTLLGIFETVARRQLACLLLKKEDSLNPE